MKKGLDFHTSVWSYNDRFIYDDSNKIDKKSRKLQHHPELNEAGRAYFYGTSLRAFSIVGLTTLNPPSTTRLSPLT